MSVLASSGFRRPDGYITVFAGGMFSEKTTNSLSELQKRLRARLPVQVFVLTGFERQSERDIEVRLASLPPELQNRLTVSRITHSREIRTRLLSTTRVVVLDELQFYDRGIVDELKQLRRLGIEVIGSGLDMTSDEVPFGPMPEILAIANEVHKCHAVCAVCGKEAFISHAIIPKTDAVLPGDGDKYEPRCSNCYHEAKQEEQEMSDRHIA